MANVKKCFVGTRTTDWVKGKSCTDKMMAGMLLDLSNKEQRSFDPNSFEQWLNHLEGWVEVDTVTGKYPVSEIPSNTAAWTKILLALAKSKNINKRRASLAFLCSPTSK